ncbi:hypothetical protein HYS49_02820 [Candidatus Woesearchaeota archaeon]|nr:hypothetical protein [Candidatus Woesearchaeota archaeon]
MAEERLAELRKLLYGLERKIKPLEWDFSRNQINEFKKLELERLKKEHQTLHEELQGLAQQKVVEVNPA